MVCKKCGKTLPNDSMFCQFCGASVDGGETLETLAKPIQKEEPTVSNANKTVNNNEIATQIKKKSKIGGKRVITFVLMTFVVLIVSGVIAFFVFQGRAVKLAEAGEYSKAKRCLFLPSITEQIDPYLNDYIDAGLLLEQGKYLEAEERFKEHLAYRNSEEMVNKSLFMYVEALANKGDYIQALEWLEKLVKAQYRPAEQSYTRLRKEAYNSAVADYRSDEVSRAKFTFVLLNGYKQSDKYLTLIDIRSAVLLEETLTDEEYKQLVSLLNFEDVGELLMENDTIATRFLAGKWKTADNKYYLNVSQQGAMTYTLPAEKKANTRIKVENGLFKLYPKRDSAVAEIMAYYDAPLEYPYIFQVDVIDKDTISVYCYKDRTTYTLYRQ